MAEYTSTPNPHEPEPSAPSTSAVQERRALTLDVDLYQGYLDDPAMSDHAKQELIEALWSIIVGFVDLGFDVLPENKNCGANRLLAGEFSIQANNALDSTGTSNSHSHNDNPATAGDKEET